MTQMKAIVAEKRDLRCACTWCFALRLPGGRAILTLARYRCRTYGRFGNRELRALLRAEPELVAAGSDASKLRGRGLSMRRQKPTLT